jgi:hypothetical protein
MKSHWVTHNGTKVFISNFSNLGGDAAAVKAECDSIRAALENEPPRSVLAITNVEGTFANEDILRVLAELVPITNKYVKRRAVVGVSGFRRHFLYAFAKVVGNINFSVFDSLPQALDWIVTE